MQASPITGCTIISKNYLSYARILADSFHEHHPQGRFVVLLCDRIDDRFDPAQESFDLITAEELGIPDFADMAMRYSILELNTAVKPFFLERLLRSSPKVVYFDPDILITGPLEELSRLLDDSNIVLTPHLTTPIDDEKLPGEREILQAGAYNLGFIALRDHAESRRMLAWWQKRLKIYCYNAVEKGLFVDQRWMDLAPGLFHGVRILQDASYNTAYWNLHERSVRGEPGEFVVNDRPLKFFHFSGFDPLSPEILSRHQNRFTFEDLPGLRPLFHHYARKQLERGFAAQRTWPYAFGFFDNGVPIGREIRGVFQDLPPAQQRAFADPFATGTGSFYEWMQTTISRGSMGSAVTNLHLAVAVRHRETEQMTGALKAGDTRAFAKWLLDPRQRMELELHPAFLQTLEPILRRMSLRMRMRELFARRHTWEAYQRSMRKLKSAIGERMFYRLQRLIRSRRHRASPKRISTAAIHAVPGVNVIGYLDAEMGLGEAVRGHVHALQAASIPHVLINDTHCGARRGDGRHTMDFQQSLPYPVHLIEINADQFDTFRDMQSGDFFSDKYPIACWAWELPSFPAEWKDRFASLREIWVYTTYVLDALSTASPVPVVRMPPVVEIPHAMQSIRPDLHIPEDTYTFLFSFDFHSVFERKNPLAVIEAYRLAFQSSDHVRLILKYSNAEHYPAQREALLQACKGLNIDHIDRYLTRQEMYNLVFSCDCYISLHRAEGFGLGMAEAMAMGKPVIGTDYSGNTDYLSDDTGFPVRYRLSELQETFGPYPAGGVWADPDIDDAARLMRFVYEHPEEATLRGKTGAAFIRSHFSAAVIGQRIAKRLSSLNISV